MGHGRRKLLWSENGPWHAVLPRFSSREPAPGTEQPHSGVVWLFPSTAERLARLAGSANPQLTRCRALHSCLPGSRGWGAAAAGNGCSNRGCCCCWQAQSRLPVLKGTRELQLLEKGLLIKFLEGSLPLLPPSLKFQEGENVAVTAGV